MEQERLEQQAELDRKQKLHQELLEKQRQLDEQKRMIQQSQ